MSWTVEFLDAKVRADLDALPADMRASFLRIAGLLISLGPHNVSFPHVRHLEGRLWEIRMKGRAGIARAVYVTAIGERIVVVHVFVKKTEATPRREIDIALQKAKGIK